MLLGLVAFGDLNLIKSYTNTCLIISFFLVKILSCWSEQYQRYFFRSDFFTAHTCLLRQARKGFQRCRSMRHNYLHGIYTRFGIGKRTPKSHLSIILVIKKTLRL